VRVGLYLHPRGVLASRLYAFPDALIDAGQSDRHVAADHDFLRARGTFGRQHVPDSRWNVLSRARLRWQTVVVEPPAGNHWKCRIWGPLYGRASPPHLWRVFTTWQRAGVSRIEVSFGLG
jgi:hypothetical protein